MKLAHAGLLALLLAVLLVPAPAEAQFRVGAHGAHAADAFGGASGLGIRAGLDVPALPIAGYAAYETFFPDCPAGESDCSLSGFSLEANFAMVMPLIQPYATGAIIWRDFNIGGEDGLDESDTGLGLGAGLTVNLGPISAFGEARYEFLEAPERQAVYRLGVLYDVFGAAGTN